MLGQAGGSAACGDVVGITFDLPPVLHTLSFCPAEQVPIVLMRNLPEFDASLDVEGFNGDSATNVAAGNVAIVAHQHGFVADLNSMVAAVREYAQAQALEPAGYDFPEAPDSAPMLPRPGWDPDRNTPHNRGRRWPQTAGGLSESSRVNQALRVWVQREANANAAPTISVLAPTTNNSGYDPVSVKRKEKPHPPAA